LPSRQGKAQARPERSCATLSIVHERVPDFVGRVCWTTFMGRPNYDMATGNTPADPPRRPEPSKTQQQVKRVIEATEGEHLPFWQQRLQGGAP
jgi:hypothetical protein